MIVETKSTSTSDDLFEQKWEYEIPFLALDEAEVKTTYLKKNKY